MTLRPLVSIGVPVYNGDRYLREALESIRSQTYSNFEVVVGDNASTDSTGDIAREFVESDARFRYYRHAENLGAAANYNFVYHRTRGPLFRWAAHDDLCTPEYLDRCVAALAEQPEAVLSYPRTTLIDADGAVIRNYDNELRRGGRSPSARLRELLIGDPAHSIINMCFPVFGVIRRPALDRSSLIANFPRSDRLLLVELALQGPFAEIDDYLFLRRTHDEGSVIAAEKSSSGVELEKRLASWFDPKRGRVFPATLTRLAMGYTHAVAALPLGSTERLRTASVLSRWLAKNARAIGGELKILLRERLRRSSASTSES